MRNEPVIARPPTVIYQLQKAWRRNKLVYTAAGMVVASLIVGVSLSVWQAIEATRAEKQAIANATLAQQNSQLAEQRATEARESEETALRRAYNSDMSLAFHALKENLFGWVQESVCQHIPKPEAPDFRGWEWRYAWAQSQSDALRGWDISDEMDEVLALQISPDQRYMVSSGSHYGPTKELPIRRLWDFQTREEQKNVHLPGGSPRALAFSDSGKFLAVHRQAPRNVNEIHIYSTATWRLDTVIQLDEWISCLSFSPDEKTLATIGTSEAVLWDWRQQTPLHDGIISRGRGSSYCDLAFFRKGHRLAIGGSDKLKIVDTRTGKIEHQQDAPDRGITALAISPDGDYVAIGSGYEVSEIGLLNTSAENPDRWEQEPSLVGHSGWVSSLTFAANGKQLISSSSDSTIRIWDMNRRDTTRVLRGHQAAVYDLSVTSDKSRALSAGKGKQILEWDLNVPLSEYRERLLPEPVREVVFSADSQSFYTINDDGSVGIWDALTQLRQPALSPKLGEQSSIILSPDGKHLIAGTGSGKLWVLDSGNLQVVAEREVGSRLILPVGFSADGKSLVALESGKKISLWNVETWELRSRVPTGFKIEYRTKNYRAISPGSDMLLYLSEADLVLWDLRQLKKQSTVRVNASWSGAGGVAVSPIEPLLARTARGNFISLWNWQTRQEADRLPGATRFWCVAFSPDGRRLLTGSSGKEALTLWDVSTRQEIARFGTQVSTILNTVQFSPDGNIICAVDIDRTAYFWAAPSWEEINALEAERNRKEVGRIVKSEL